MRRLEDQGFITRYARQDDNKRRIEEFTKSLEEAIEAFSVSRLASLPTNAILKRCSYHQLNLQMSVHRQFITFQVDMDERHGEVLEISRMSETEREVRVIVTSDVVNS
jgi:hypothetical protein